MANVEEVGIRLGLLGRAEFLAGLRDAKGALGDLGAGSRTAGDAAAQMAGKTKGQQDAIAGLREATNAAVESQRAYEAALTEQAEAAKAAADADDEAAARRKAAADEAVAAARAERDANVEAMTSARDTAKAEDDLAERTRLAGVKRMSVQDAVAQSALGSSLGIQAAARDTAAVDATAADGIAAAADTKVSAWDRFRSSSMGAALGIQGASASTAEADTEAAAGIEGASARKVSAWDRAKNSSLAASLGIQNASKGVAQQEADEAAAVERSNNTMTSSFDAVGNHYTAAAGVVAIGAGAIIGVTTQMAANFQSSTQRMVSSAGETEQNLDMVRQGILGMAGSVGYSADELSTAMYKIESGGQHGAQGLDVLKAAAQGAKTENADLTTVADAVTSALTDYHLPAQSAADVTSKLVAATASGKMTFQDLAASMSNILPVASAAHVSLNDILADEASMTMHGVSAQQASQNLANAIRSMQNPSQVAQKELAALGLSGLQVQQSLGQNGLSGTVNMIGAAITKQMGPGSQEVVLNLTNAMKGMAPAVQDLGQKMLTGAISQGDFVKAAKELPPELQGQASGLAALAKQTHAVGSGQQTGAQVMQTYAGALAKATGNATSMNVALMIGGENAGNTANAYRAISGATADAQGNVAHWNEIQQTFNQKLSEAKSGLGALAIQMGQVFLPIVSAILGPLGAVATWFGQHRVAAIALAAVVGGILVVALTVLTIGLAAAAVSAWGLAAAALGIEIGFAPLILIVLAVVAVFVLLGVIIYQVVTHWHDITAAVSGAWSAISGFFSRIGSAIGGFASTAWSAITGFFSRLPGEAMRALEAVGRFLAALPGNVAEGIGYGLGATVRFFIELPGRIERFMTDAGNWLRDTGKRIVVGLATGFVDAYLAVVTFFIALPERIRTFFVSAGNWLRDTGKRVVVGLATGFVDAYLAVVTFFIALPGRIKAFFTGAPGWLAHVGGDIWHGFVNGLTSAFAAVAGWVVNMVTRFVEGFEHGLGIASPSTVFARIGGDILRGLVQGLEAAAGFVLSMITGLVRRFISGFQNEWNALRAVALAIWNAVARFFETVWNNEVAFWTNLWGLISSIFSSVWNGVRAVATAIWHGIASFFETVWNNEIAFWRSIWSLVTNVFTSAWNAIRTWAVTIWNAIYSWFQGALNAYFAFWQNIWNDVYVFFENIWNRVRTWAVTIWTMIKEWFQGELNAYFTFWQNIWNNIYVFFENIWNRIRTWATVIWTEIKQWFQGELNAFVAIWQTIWNNVSQKFSDIWNGIKQTAQNIWAGIKTVVDDGVNGIIDGVNWMATQVNKILSFLHIPTIPAISHVALAAGGVVGMADGGVLPTVTQPVTYAASGTAIGPGFVTAGPRVVVGEGRRNHPEFVVPTDPQYRSRALQLHGALSERLGLAQGGALAAGGTVGPGLDIGGVLGGAASWVGNIASSVASGASSLLGDVGNALGDLGGWITGDIGALTQKVGGAINSMLPDGMLKGAGTWIAQQAVPAVQNMIMSAFAAMGGGGGAAAPAQVAAWIMEALAILHLPASLEPGIANIIMHESSGNPNAINLTDSNAQAGHPSQGLMQTIPSTFAAYALPGLGGITNPVANIVAGVRYAIANYGEAWLAGGGNRSSGGGYRGYASGGIVGAMDGMPFGGARALGGDMSPGSAYLVGENGPELVTPRSESTVIPADYTAGMTTPPPGENLGTGGSGSVVFQPGAIVVNGAADPEATAQAVAQAVSNRMARQ